MKPISNLKRMLKDHRSSSNLLARYGSRLIFSSYHLLRTWKIFITDKDYRYVTLLKLRKPQEVHQTTTLTLMDRYPGIFSVCASYFSGRKELKILSFGCSTGEEVISLRQYFPSAWIVGAEINPQALAKCREREVDGRIEFIVSDREAIEHHGPYDVIFCMAVLQRTPHLIAARGTTNLKPIYPFEKFDRQVSELDQCLRENGLLVIHHTQYMLEDTSVAPRYQALIHGAQEQDTGPKFDSNSQLKVEPNLQSSIFIKKRQ